MLYGPGILREDKRPDDPVLVFDNASGNYIRHGEGLGCNLDSPAFDQCLLKWLAGKFYDLSVGMNGPRFQAADRAEERNLDLDISVLLAFIIQDLNAVIEELRLISVVNIIRIVKLDG